MNDFINYQVYYEFVDYNYTHYMCWTIQELEDLMKRKFSNYDFVNDSYEFFKVVVQKKNRKYYYFSSLNNLKNGKYDFIERR